jgi:hypothetical protein
VVWPDELELRFYAVHLLTASAFALRWMLAILGAWSSELRGEAS